MAAKLSSRWGPIVLFALPGIVLAAVGVTHPAHLTADSAAHWWRMHVVLLPLFPLLGLSLAALMGRRHDAMAWAVRVFAYVFVVAYGALDVLAGIATGYVIDPAVTSGDGPTPTAVERLFAIGNGLGTIGSRAFLLAAAVVAVDVVRRVGRTAVVPGLVLVLASVSFLDSHIYRWRGVITVLVIGLAMAWLAWVRSVAELSEDGELRAGGGVRPGP